MFALRLLAAPFDEPFVAELIALAERVFGACDGSELRWKLAHMPEVTAQHAWVRARGYRTVETGALVDNAAMLTLNLQFGFRIIGMYQRTGTARAVMLKDL